MEQRELWRIHNSLYAMLTNCEYHFYDTAVTFAMEIMKGIDSVETSKHRLLSRNYYKFRSTVLYDVYRRCEAVLTLDVGYSGVDETNIRCDRIKKLFGITDSEVDSPICKLVMPLVFSKNNVTLIKNIRVVFESENYSVIRDYITNAIDRNHTNNGSSVDMYWKKSMFSCAEFDEYVNKLMIQYAMCEFIHWRLSKLRKHMR